MDRQFYSYSSRKICFALLGVCLLLGSVSVLKHFIVHESGAFIAKLSSMPFYPAKDQLNSVKISSSLHRFQSHPLRILTNLAPAPAPAQTSVDSHRCERVCGQVQIPYPFGLSPACAHSSKFLLLCIQSNRTLAQQNLQDPVGPWPFLSTLHGSSFQVISISSTYMIINATKIKAMPTTPSQGGSCDDLGNASLVLDPDGPYMISSANIVFMSGCKSVGGYSLEQPLQSLQEGNGNYICSPTSCEIRDEPPICNVNACCVLQLYYPTRNIYMMGAGISSTGHSNICGFCTIAYPSYDSSTWNAAVDGGQYRVQLLWAIQDHSSCSAARFQADYACTPEPAARCIDVGEVPGYLCDCTMGGYVGDGYRNGSGCSDVNECENGLKGDVNRYGISCSHPNVALIAGTPGYMDPEYFDNFQISDKSDVYSFGVVLIELITAKKPVDLSREPGDQNLVIRFSGHMKEVRLEDMMDVALDASSDPQMLGAIYKVAEVALKCVLRSRKYRPSMKEVLDELDLINKSYKESTSITSFEPSDQECVPLKAGMFDSFGDYEFSSSHRSNFPPYGSSSSSFANV